MWGISGSGFSESSAFDQPISLSTPRLSRTHLTNRNTLYTFGSKDLKPHGLYHLIQFRVKPNAEAGPPLMPRDFLPFGARRRTTRNNIQEQRTEYTATICIYMRWVLCSLLGGRFAPGSSFLGIILVSCGAFCSWILVLGCCTYCLRGVLFLGSRSQTFNSWAFLFLDPRSWTLCLGGVLFLGYGRPIRTRCLTLLATRNFFIAIPLLPP